MVAKPRLLDLFCGAGGAGMGYHRAGFEVTGVDIEPQPNYPFEFVRADAMTFPLAGFDVIHASPPCQAYAESAQDRKRDDNPDLLLPVLERLGATGKPYVIENIPTAPMPGSVVLCGSTFDLPIVRHRRFWVVPDLILVPSLCHQGKYARSVDHGPRFAPYAQGSWEARWRAEVLPVVWPWMMLNEAGQAIPPAYTEFIGGQLIESLGLSTGVFSAARGCI
jgi:DNA (cytosine-5)-methyltransferase 1